MMKIPLLMPSHSESTCIQYYSRPLPLKNLARKLGDKRKTADARLEKIKKTRKLTRVRRC